MDAIGSVLTSGAERSSNTTLNQADFLKLFLTQLNFQDPMEPVDNREFLAQIAQFSQLEESKKISDGIGDLVLLNSTAQSVSLISKTVQVETAAGPSQQGTVSAINFTAEGPLLTVTFTAGGFDNNIRLSQVKLVR